VRLAAAARQVGLATSTAGRLMVTLEAMGFIWRDNDGYYRPGPQVLQLGAVAVHRMPLYQLAEPHLWQLANGTDETAYLAVLDRDGEHAMYLRQVESPKAIRHASWAGRAVRTAGTAVGAALLDRVSPDGYATSRNTIEPDAAAAAAPVYGASREVVAALSIIGPSFRISDDDLTRFGKLVAKQAQVMSAELGCPDVVL
jgi:DNA-binding IclR family transcriptional regulator